MQFVFPKGRISSKLPAIQNPTTIGEMIRKRRLDMRLMQAEVAKIVGCDTTTITNWEKGHSATRTNHLAGVVRILGFNPLPTGNTIAERLVTHRKARGLTQKQFASDLGVDPTSLAKWEGGEREPKGRFEQIVTTVLAESCSPRRTLIYRLPACLSNRATVSVTASSANAGIAAK